MSVKRLSSTAVLAAVYALTTLLLAPLSFGVVQCRIAEVLCLLPYFFPESVWGLFLGCAMANLLTGNMMDFVIGSLATLLAGLAVAELGRRRSSAALACFMPVLFNGLMVGFVITLGYEGLSPLRHPLTYALNSLSVAAGEALVLYALGLPLLRALPRSRFFPLLGSFFGCTKEQL